MNKNKLAGFILGSFVLGILIGGAYVNSFGVNMPLRDSGNKSSAMMQGGSGAEPGTRCSYRTANGSIRYGRVAIWEDFRDVCQSSTGWSKNFEVY